MALLALRVVIGWHFYKEGVTKLQGAPYSSGALFGAAKGPLAEVYRFPVYDPYGEARLDLGRTEAIWAKYRDRLKNSDGVDANEKKEFDRIEASHRRRLRALFDEIRPDLAEYRGNVKRLKQYRQDPARLDVPGLRSQINTIEREVKQKAGPWLSQIDGIWNDFEADMQAAYAKATGGSAPGVVRPGRRWYDTETIDRIVPYFDTILGTLLILGLFTRFAGWLGALFLATIIASQWPGAPETVPTYYQTVECLGLVVLATVGAGQFAGLDVFVSRLWRNCCRPQGEAKA